MEKVLEKSEPPAESAPRPGRDMPDVARQQRLEHPFRLERVGMEDIECIVNIEPSLNSTLSSLQVPARATAFVNLLDAEKRGIHMSRLYTGLIDSLKKSPLGLESIQSLMKHFLDSHSKLSDKAELKLNFDLPLMRKALVSDNLGMRFYPIGVRATQSRSEPRPQIEVSLRIVYSSTCPCSAALARQLIQERFKKDFSQNPDKALSLESVYEWLGAEQGIMATPHSQRSHMDVKLIIDPSKKSHWNFSQWINLIEGALQTPVQSAVKREDEQRFAELNGANTMFCEDAARRVKATLESVPGVSDYWLKATHMESLHPHDAVAIAVKGISGGFQP